MGTHGSIGAVNRTYEIKPAVKATSFKGERSSKNTAFVDALARKNVELTMAGIRNNSAVLKEIESKVAIKIGGSKRRR